MVASTETNLESMLWEAANILRGPVDATDFKAYVFPLLFLKRISDVYDEERSGALEESSGDEEYADLPEQHRFQIPDGAHWTDLRARTTNVGQVIQRAMREIEKANPKRLYGIFGDVQWTNKARLSDELLVDLVDHFSWLDLRNAAVTNDVLGDAYEYLIKKFADLTNRKAGEFYTPRPVVELMVRMLAPRAGETVYDPACGTGGMLLETLQQVREAGGDERLMLGRLFGQEKNLTTEAIARMNLFLHGAEDFEIIRGDTLRNPLFLSGDRLAVFDCVIANPPFSLSAWGGELWAQDPWGRNLAGTPPKKYGDWAWVQHMISSMAPATGRMAVVLPHGALFRMGAEGKIRTKILEMDLIEAVIGLGPNLFYGTGLAACILVARQHKAPDRQQKVLLVDGSDLYRKGRNQNTLEPGHVAELLAAFNNFADEDGRSRVVALDEIREQSGNLNLAGYVSQADDTETPTVAEATLALEAALRHVWEAEDQLNKLLAERGIA
ncbi:MAG: class I SAM-dependent DNA methyltransferase [Acidimicrobiaceae bacterium]|nr:class I SAM-dependent DNA methyltransferase [Acidimicrobiaceae bacterium]